jgi:hypothetical protein
VPTNCFDERIAKGYEAKWTNPFEPDVINPAVSSLADLAGSGAPPSNSASVISQQADTS